MNKKYIEPDFIIKYHGNKYKLIELERPSKIISTVQGQPRTEVAQAAFQIAEWRSYIYNHYNLIQDKFPGISNPTNCSSMVVISRATKESFLCRNESRYMELVNLQFSCEIIIYDDLLKRAKQAIKDCTSINNRKNIRCWTIWLGYSGHYPSDIRFMMFTTPGALCGHCKTLFLEPDKEIFNLGCVMR